MVEAILASGAVALCSLLGVFFFGDTKRLTGIGRYIVPTAVGVFLSLVLFELIPETLHANETWGGVMVAVGFLAFYILSYLLHNYFHAIDEENCERKGAAMLLLTGDAVHNVADGVILGVAFLIDPAVGIATAIGLALHEIPQEIVEFGVLIRAGYSRLEAALRNLLSASSIVLGTVATLVLAAHAEAYIWIITGLAAGNLLYLAASDLLPRMHGSLPRYGSFWYAIIAIVFGFAVMTATLVWTHETFGHGHTETEIDENTVNLPHTAEAAQADDSHDGHEH